MKVWAVIPARFGSTRFAGKVLAKDTGKFLIQHTYERACLARLPDKVIIAADDERIAAAAKSFGAECVLTSPAHKSGTDRIAEAVADVDVDIVLNIQADEPEIDPANIDLLAQLLIETQNSKPCPERTCPERGRGSRRIKTQNCGMATLAAEFESSEQVKDPNIVKVVVDSDNFAIYFSRSVIPYDRAAGGVGKTANYLRHLGIYAYRKEFLLKTTALPQSGLEKIEKLEQLRAIENGFAILVGKVEHTCDGIDTPQQYADFVKRYKERQK